MVITLKHKHLCLTLWNNTKLQRLEKISIVVESIETAHHTKLETAELSKIENFVKLFDKKMQSVTGSILKFKTKYSQWMDDSMDILFSAAGAPCKPYDDLCEKSKKKRTSLTLSKHSNTEVCDTFKEMLKKENRPKEALQIADVVPTASPKRLKRIVKSIPTPSSETDFTEEEAIALMLELGLSKNKYLILRTALIEKGHTILPSYFAIKDKKDSLLPSPIAVNEHEACIDLSTLLENTASRIVSDFSIDQLKRANNCDVVLMCKWGCDGLSALPEYKHASGGQNISTYKSVFMSSLVPLRIRSYSTTEPSTNNAFDDVWINSAPGSKAFCRPIGFEYIKESNSTTKNLVEYINGEIDTLEPIYIEIGEYTFNISFKLSLTMIDGKVCNAITDTLSTWKCPICNENKSQFSNISKERTINEDVLAFGISPLHARIRFMEHFLHIAYDLKYKTIPGNENKTVKKNEVMGKMRADEKNRIQEEFRRQTGLNIDKPLAGFGSTNDGNTARRFFRDFETTSKITGIDKELLRKINIILMAVNSKHNVNASKFGVYAEEITQLLVSLYAWKEMTPTVHKVLCHGKVIVEYNILPLGELTEEAQEARNRDFKHAQLFSSRKCSRQSQNEDIFNNLLLSSDPVLSSMRKRWICYNTLASVNNEELKDLLYLLDLNHDVSDYFVLNKEN